MYCSLSGGLGNQMFQYAAAYIMHTQTPGSELILDNSYYISQPKRDTKRLLEIEQFSINFSRLTNDKEKKDINLIRKLRKSRLPLVIRNLCSGLFLGKYEVTESNYFERLSVDNNKAVFLDYYQFHTHLDMHRDAILKAFELNAEVSKYCRELDIYKLIAEKGETTAIHVRRGDYVTNQHANKLHGVLGLDYYSKAMELIESRRGKQSFIFFSDDPVWVKETFGDNENYYFVGAETNKFSAIDIYLMSICNNNIIANSTYSWWSAWLNKFQDNLTVAPNNWFVNDMSKGLRKKGWIYL